MSTFSHRVGFSFIPGSLATFATLVFMVTLLTTTNQVVTSQPERTIEPFLHTEREVAPKPTQKKPELAPPAEKVPARLIPPTTTDPKIGPSEKITYIQEAINPDLNAPANSDYIPLYVPQPRYPSRALNRGIDGYAVIQFTISTNGSTAQTQLLEESPEGYGFGRAALQAAGKLKYNPKTEDGVAVEVEGVSYKFSFKIAD